MYNVASCGFWQCHICLIVPEDYRFTNRYSSTGFCRVPHLAAITEVSSLPSPVNYSGLFRQTIVVSVYSSSSTGKLANLPGQIHFVMLNDRYNAMTFTPSSISFL